MQVTTVASSTILAVRAMVPRESNVESNRLAALQAQDSFTPTGSEYHLVICCEGKNRAVAAQCPATLDLTSDPTFRTWKERTARWLHEDQETPMSHATQTDTNNISGLAWAPPFANAQKSHREANARPINGPGFRDRPPQG